MTQVSNLLDLIGNTPIVQVKNMDTGPCDLFLKMEGMNPGSSIKDRVALQIIEAAEQEGLLNKGSTIIEASAGNTALGLALIGKLKGYKSKVVILDKMNQNKIFHLKAVGAEVIITRSDVGPEHPEHYITLAKKSANIQINELKKIKKIFNNSFIKAIDLILNCKGKVIFAGIGKSGLIARKISATFSI